MLFGQNESTVLSSAQLNLLQRAFNSVPVQTPDDLRLAIDRHVLIVETASLTHPLVDIVTCRKVAELLSNAVGHWEHLSEQHRAWLHAAVVYFATSNDDEHDLHSPIGFDDDLELTQAVVRAIGLPLPRE
ncbi:MAG: hypothetical protein ACO1RT_14210 [Planctomycetaceae bacterium]